MTILLIEDDERIVTFVKRGLEAEGYLVDAAHDGEEAMGIAASPVYQLIILDLMLPRIDGQEICRRLRAQGVQTPIMMLTAMDGVDQKVKGLRMGADDYLTKPFAFDELLARVEVLLRRRGDFEPEPGDLAVADLHLNDESKEVRRAGQTVDLTPKEYALLRHLMKAPGKVHSRTRLLETVWGYSADPLTNVVEVYIRNLRRKIDHGHEKSLIKTVRGFGYKLDAE